jgi:flagellar basal-body rod modification protein FlgD
MPVSSPAPTTPALPASTVYSPGQSQTAALPTQTLSQADFLKLLVAQLSAQDPMNPVSNTDFIGQMAQFSALQETQSMQQTVAGLQASNLLGQTVQVQDGKGQAATGVVSSIQFQSGVPWLMVNGQAYSLNQIVAVSQAKTQTKPPSLP